MAEREDAEGRPEHDQAGGHREEAQGGEPGAEDEVLHDSRDVLARGGAAHAGQQCGEQGDAEIPSGIWNSRLA